MGIQGSGKSTQGNLLSKKFTVPYLSSGHIFREMAKEKSKWGRYVKELLNAGILIPDRHTIPILEEYLSKPEYKKGYILDGFPRTLVQAKAFKNGIDHVVYIKISDKEALWRISYRDDHNRDDETLAAIRKRIELFHEHAEPVLSYYRRKKLLREINGEQPIKRVYHDILKAIGVK